MSTDTTHQLPWTKDVQFHEGVREMFRYQRNGADFFRRKCNVGYNKASSWVEQLEVMGFLGPRTTDGSARTIRVTFAQWLAWLDSRGVVYDRAHDTYKDPWVEEPYRALPRPAVTVIPDYILTLAERLRTQDNRSTGWPMFCVQRLVRHHGIDVFLADQTEFRHRGGTDAVPHEHSDAIRKAMSDGETSVEVGGHTYNLAHLEEYGYQDEWVTVMACLTEQGAKDYIAANGHNLTKHGQGPQIYVESFHRCEEMIKLREWLMSLNAEAAHV